MKSLSFINIKKAKGLAKTVSHLDYFIKTDFHSVTSNNSAISRVIHYIVDNIQNEISHDDLVRVSGYSKFHFNRYFYSKLKMTPIKWLWNYRLALAFLRIKSEPNQTLHSIALSCGFSSFNSFYRAYKRTYGFSPSQTNHGHYIHTEKLKEVLLNICPTKKNTDIL